MSKRQARARDRHGLQAVTLCISTALVLILLGLVVFSVFTARGLSDYVRQNFVVTLSLEDDMTSPEAQAFCKRLEKQPYIHSLRYISKEEALSEGTKTLGADPREFVDTNPFLSSVELTLKSDYATSDSLATISKALKALPKVSSVSYQKDLIDSVNRNIARMSIVMLALAVLLSIISFALINNTVRLGIYARRFNIHTMKLVGASWGFIRWPYVRSAMLVGLLASLIACACLGGGFYALCLHEPEVLSLLTWQVAAITAGTVVVFGIAITSLCAAISVGKFLRMKAGELYKI